MERTASDGPGPKDVFLRSLARCDVDPGFLERFYEHFMASSSEVREKFMFTDFDRQRRMLRQSLELMARATDGNPEGLRELSDRAETHGRAKLDIEPHLYDLWLESLLVTASESDPEWTPAVESAWRLILGVGIRHMLRRYPG